MAGWGLIVVYIPSIVRRSASLPSLAPGTGASPHRATRRSSGERNATAVPFHFVELQDFCTRHSFLWFKSCAERNSVVNSRNDIRNSALSKLPPFLWVSSFNFTNKSEVLGWLKPKTVLSDDSRASLNGMPIGLAAVAGSTIRSFTGFLFSRPLGGPVISR